MADVLIPEAVDLYVVYDSAELPAPDEEAREIEAPRYVRTERAPYASPAGQMDAMWDAARRDRDRKKQKVDPGGQIVRLGLPTLPLPPKPKGVLNRVLMADWECDERRTCVEVGAALYLGRSDTHQAGDVKVPAHLEYRWSVHGALVSRGQRVAWFWATWERREVGAKPGNKFADALTWDPVSGKTYEDTATGFEEWLSIFVPKVGG